MTAQSAFDELMTRVDHPMLIVTTTAGDLHAGCMVGFHCQCSIDPPLYAVWISKANRTLRVAALADTFGLHFLEAADGDLAALFGGVTGDDEDKFAHCTWTPGPEGIRLLDGCRARVTARRVAMFDTGSDHVCFVLAPVRTDDPGDFEPLLFSEVLTIEAGHDAHERQRPQ